MSNNSVESQPKGKQGDSAGVDVIILMGVSGCGKSSIGKALASKCKNSRFVDGDDFHSEAAKNKMKNSIPLDDNDRFPWLNTLASIIHQACLNKQKMVLACSALKKNYRKLLSANHEREILFLHLDIPRSVLLSRLSQRKGHFMPASLLDSQLSTLELPDSNENILFSIFTPLPTSDEEESVSNLIRSNKTYLESWLD